MKWSQSGTIIAGGNAKAQYTSLSTPHNPCDNLRESPLKAPGKFYLYLLEG
jgi:hypothetical protein